MKVIDEAMLDEFRSKTQCAWCGRRVPACDPAHIFSRGAGRCDIRENIVNLDRICHRLSHDGHEPRRDQLLRIAAERDGTTPAAIEAKVNRLRRRQDVKVWDVAEMGQVPDVIACALCGEDRDACYCEDSLPF